jgi:4-diphosphocytidyl-2-C-methyl-D-erythritol kinase
MDRPARPLGMTHWPAPAKLNLFLHVLGRRTDGYHELQSVFQFLDFSDQLSFRIRSDGKIRRTADLPGLPESDDLTLRAAVRLQSESGTGRGCDITLHKRIPTGGGLGGGSSDAATTLVALNHLWQLDWESERLCRLGLELGADVPVFIRGQAAWAEGIGERLTPMTLPEPWFLVITPDCAVSTREIFQDPELPRGNPPATPEDFQAGRVRNDCTGTVRTRYPEVGRALDWLSAHGAARMSGTGASVFAAFDGRARAEAVRAQVPAPWTAFVARGLNQSPLRLACDALTGR